MNESYLDELARNLRHRGFAADRMEDAALSVKTDGKPLCLVSAAGSVHYQEGDVADGASMASLDKVIGTAAATFEYMGLMDKAPRLAADGLEGDYRLLSEFNGVVLAAHPTKYGVQFVTWGRTHDGAGLCHGHYFCPPEQGYADAKRDFAVRSGLVGEDDLRPARFVYRITEIDADEYGNIYSLYVSSKTPIRGDLAVQLRRFLRQTRMDGAGNYETDELMIVAALEDFKTKTGIEYELCEDPFDGEFEF